jgi:hypothetical protein
MVGDEMLEGYMEGFASELKELPNGNNRSDSYRHGWNNGRDDRLKRPRASAATLRKEADDIAAREQSYL